MNLSRAEVELGIAKVAGRLSRLRDGLRFVFIGGGSVPLHATVQRPEHEYRRTKDVDVVISVATYADYQEVGVELRKLGFSDDMQLPIRWHLDGLMVDVMPTTDIGHGMGNRWFHLVLEHTVPCALADGTVVELAAAPVLLATKLEAFEDRGKGDAMASHDLEDIITLLDGRPELPDEANAMPAELRIYLAQQAASLLSLGDLENILEGNLEYADGNEGRVAAVIARLQQLARLR